MTFFLWSRVEDHTTGHACQSALPDVMPLYVQGPCREYRWGRSVCNLQPMFYHLFLKMGLIWLLFFFIFIFLLAKSGIIKRLLPSEKARIKGQAEVTAAILFHLRGEKLGMPWFVTTITFWQFKNQSKTHKQGEYVVGSIFFIRFFYVVCVRKWFSWHLSTTKTEATTSN